MKWLKNSWVGTWFNKDPEYHMRKDKKKLAKNIYADNITVEKHIKKFHVIHFIFKYKFFVPLLRLGNKLLGKHIITKVPKVSHNRNLIIFDKAFEDAMKVWYCDYLRNSGDPLKREGRKTSLKRCKSNETLRTMKNYIITMYLYDTAYREFMNILMHKIARGMVDEYKKPEYLNNSTGHLFFTTDVYDVHYYILEKAIRYQTELAVADTQKLLQEHYEREMMKKQAKRVVKNGKTEI
jgi:hypothetical protein